MMRNVRNSRRSRRPSCSLLALATVLAVGATPAAAQSFNGTGTFAVNGGGSANIATGAGTTTITLNSGNSVINWTPTDNALAGGNIVFQNSGTTALFTASNDFAVLNNINTASLTRVVEMDGTIQARVGTSQRGAVYFYAPGGFLLGGTSIVSVGSLGLSALPISNASFAGAGN